MLSDQVITSTPLANQNNLVLYPSQKTPSPEGPCFSDSRASDNSNNNLELKPNQDKNVTKEDDLNDKNLNDDQNKKELEVRTGDESDSTSQNCSSSLDDEMNNNRGTRNAKPEFERNETKNSHKKVKTRKNGRKVKLATRRKNKSNSSSSSENLQENTVNERDSTPYDEVDGLHEKPCKNNKVELDSTSHRKLTKSKSRRNKDELGEFKEFVGVQNIIQNLKAKTGLGRNDSESFRVSTKINRFTDAKKYNSFKNKSDTNNNQNNAEENKRNTIENIKDADNTKIDHREVKKVKENKKLMEVKRFCASEPNIIVIEQPKIQYLQNTHLYRKDLKADAMTNLQDNSKTQGQGTLTSAENKHCKEKPHNLSLPAGLSTVPVDSQPFISGKQIDGLNLDIGEIKRDSSNEDTVDRCIISDKMIINDEQISTNDIDKACNDKMNDNKSHDIPRITWSVSAVRQKFEMLCTIGGDNSAGKLSRRSSINKRKSPKGSLRRKKSSERVQKKPSIRKKNRDKEFSISNKNDYPNSEDYGKMTGVQLNKENLDSPPEIIELQHSPGAVRAARNRFEIVSDKITNVNGNINCNDFNNINGKNTSNEKKLNPQNFLDGVKNMNSKNLVDDHESSPEMERLTSRKVNARPKRSNSFKRQRLAPVSREGSFMEQRENVVICWRGPYRAQVRHSIYLLTSPAGQSSITVKR